MVWKDNEEESKSQHRIRRPRGKQYVCQQHSLRNNMSRNPVFPFERKAQNSKRKIIVCRSSAMKTYDLMFFRLLFYQFLQADNALTGNIHFFSPFLITAFYFCLCFFGKMVRHKKITIVQGDYLFSWVRRLSPVPFGQLF